MSYQQNRGNNRGNAQRNFNNSNDGQTGAKRRRFNRWSNKPRVRDNEMALKRERRSESENFDIDTPLFKTPFASPRSSNNRSRDRHNYNDQQFVDDRYDNYDSPSYQSSLASPGHNMRDARLSSPQSRKPQPDMRSRQFVEPQHSGPAWYWEKYFNEIHNWQDKHKLSYYKSRCMALEFENQMLFDQVKSLIEENSVFATERGEVPTMLLPNFPGGLKGFENEKATGEKPSTSKTSNDKGKHRESSDESLVCDIPDSMIAVIEKSMRHKLDLYNERKAEKQKSKCEEKKEGVKTDAPNIPRGFKRKEEMDQLFGENAELIQQLETSLQHDFNRNCDTFNPPMWMDVPINPIVVV